jgi:hypothetical protein
MSSRGVTDPDAPKKPPYEPPTIEDVPINPEERMLVACKASGDFNPACLALCAACSAPGS